MNVPTQKLNGRGRGVHPWPRIVRPEPAHPVIYALLTCILLVLGDTPLAEAQDGCSGPWVCHPTVSASSRSPGAGSGYEVTFVTPVAIHALTGSIVMELHQDIRAPNSIAPSRIRIRYRRGDDRANGVASDVSLFNQRDSRRPTTVNIVHAIRDGNSHVSIPAGAEVTVIFSREAAISNPARGGSFDWKVGVDSDDHLVNASHPEDEVRKAFRQASAERSVVGLLVDREVRLSREESSRGQSLTVTGRGYRDGRTLTVWRDADLNGQRDSGEPVLCETTVASNHNGSCSFTVSSPPFVTAFGECVNGSSLNCNFINATDQTGGSSVFLGQGTARIYDTEQVLELVGRIQVDSVQGPGGVITLELIDFPAGVVTSIDIGGVPADIDPMTVGSSGYLHLRVPVPDQVRPGRQYLTVRLTRRDNGAEYSNETIVDISQSHTVVQVYPETVLANQRVAISGSGFSTTEGAHIAEVQFDGAAIDSSRVNRGGGSIEITDDGRWSGYLNLPLLEAVTVPGIHLLQVRDSQGRTGSVEVTVQPAEVTLSPVWGRPGSIVRVSGEGFPSRNDDGSSVVLRISYKASNRFTVVSTEPDVHGNFSQDVLIPLKTATPSSNLVRVEYDDDDGVTVATTVGHEVPAAALNLSPQAGPPGTVITMRGSGFRSFVPVKSVVFAHLDVLPGNREFTDGKGEFILTFLAPAVDTGQHNVQVEVAEATASSTFDVTVPGTAPGVPTPVAKALEELGDRLVRVFHFDNDLKRWAFYDPELGEENSLAFLVAVVFRGV